MHSANGESAIQKNNRHTENRGWIPEKYLISLMLFVFQLQQRATSRSCFNLQSSSTTGFHITFVNTEFNHKRFLRSLGPNSLDGLPNFQFESIPFGLPDSDENTTQDVTLLADSVQKQNFLAPFRALLKKLTTMPYPHPTILEWLT